MATITPISILNRIGQPGAPSFLSPGELAYNQPETTAPVEPLDALYVGNGTSVSVLVGSARQVELWGAQTITGIKTIDIADLKITGGQPEWLLTTDGNGNISWTNAPGGGLTQVATDATLTGLGTVASPLGVVPHAVAVAADGVTISGNGTTTSPLAVIGHTVAVATDGVTINGNGTAASPLMVDPDTIPVVTNATLTGNGTTASPLAVVPLVTNSTLSGNGFAGNPLGVVAHTVAVAVDGITITGNGTTGSPLQAMNGTVAIATDGVTLGGSGVTASPLHVLPNTVPVATNTTLTGNGTTATPLGLAAPVSLQNGGTGVNASSNTTLLTALGAASTAQVAAGYVALAGSTMTGLLTLSGNATSPLNPVSLQQMNSAVAAVPANVYGTTAPTSPVSGTLWFNPTTSVLQMWSGSAWVTVVPATMVTGVTLQGDSTGTVA